MIESSLNLLAKLVNKSIVVEAVKKKKKNLLMKPLTTQRKKPKKLPKRPLKRQNKPPKKPQKKLKSKSIKRLTR